MNCLLAMALGLLVSVMGDTPDPLVVFTRKGAVRGQLQQTRGGRPYTSFLGIPYAKAPTGRLRFQSPVSPDPWVGVLNATKECSDCIQQYVLIEAVRTTVSGSEDCLCVNVYTPSPCANKLPVILFIHGGAYVGGSGSPIFYGGDIYLDQNVVLVAMNYRLGVMGFLSTGDVVIPGNFGMKDQALAMKWVRQNIANFGGDPNCITLVGESAGATSVSLHQHSPLSQGLFDKAIQESGSLLNPWAMVLPEVLRGRAAMLAREVGCPLANTVAFLKCLQQIPADQLVNTTHTFLFFDIDPLTIWGPTIEVSAVKNAFLTTDPRCSIQTSRKPLLIGLNAAEGGLKTTTVVGSHPQEKFARWNREFYSLMPASLLYKGTELDNFETTRAIRRFYFGSDTKPLTPDMLKQITNLYGDFWFNNGVLDEVEGRPGLTFLYFYDYNKTISACPLILLGKDTPYVGACHFDELSNFFPVQGLAAPFDPADPDYILSVNMVKLWTNFARTSNPSTDKIQWRPVRSDATEHLEITKYGFHMKSHLLVQRRNFWKLITRDRRDIFENRDRSKFHNFFSRFI